MENIKGHKIKIIKKDGRAVRVELDDRLLAGAISVEINSKYDIKNSQEVVKIELTNIESLEIIGD